MIISISDNGIGRAASAQLNLQHNTHQSFATEATAKRIALLNSNKKDIVNVEIIDNIAENNSPTGTTVIITISINGK